MNTTPETLRLVIVTGHAGAGLSTARTTLEDNGFTVVDNPPLALLTETLARLESQSRAVAFGVDVRAEGYDAALLLDFLKAQVTRPGVSAKLLFLECDGDVLLQRFSATRRRHPLSVEDGSVSGSIGHERELLQPLKKRTDVMLDTTELNANELRRLISGHFPATLGPMTLSVMSFSYRMGIPREADYVFDVRFLRNPHWVPELRPHTGKVEGVGAYIAEDDAFPPYWEGITQLISTALPRYAAEGKQYLTIAFGCTGGKHRSVYMAERMAKWLTEKGHTPHVRHREQEQAS